MSMKRLFLSAVTIIMMMFVFPLGVSADNIKLPAPEVEYKLLNHDRIKLRWNEISGADGYFIYKTDVQSGKNLMYLNPVKGTEVTVPKLEAETEYIFKVAAYTENNGKKLIGKKSSGTRLTTPREWYIETSEVKKGFPKIVYRKSYDGKTVEKIFDYKLYNNFRQVRAVYTDGWYYISGVHGDIYRIPEDGKSVKTIVGSQYTEYTKLCITKDHIYLHTMYDTAYGSADWNILYIVSRKTGKLTEIPGCLWTSFKVEADNYIYYTTCSDIQYDEKNKSWKFNYKSAVCFGKIKTDGTEEEILCEFDLPENADYISSWEYDIDNDVFRVLCDNNVIYTLYPHDEKPFDEFDTGETGYALDFKVQNGYIYYNVYKDSDDYFSKSPQYYVRMKNDGTDITRQTEPFEWYY